MRRLVGIGLLSGFAGLAAASAGEARAEEPVTVATATSPSFMNGGPSFRETGRIAEMRPTAAPTQLAAERAPELVDREQKVRVYTPRPEATAAGTLNTNALFDSELRPYLRGVRSCRIDVARDRQVALDTLPGGNVKLSWRILPNGAAVNAAAVASGASDPDVLKCIGRKMFRWRFTPPKDGAVDVAYNVTLR